MSSERDEGDSADDADGYVHEPDSVERDGTDDEGADDDGTDDSDGFGRQGWLLVGGVIVCFLVIPGLIYLKPAVPAAAGLPFFATFLVLPLIPAVILGLLAVWSMRAAA
ncbi:hypothetical protein EGH24_07105 [Halonotius terrestris]|uniref:Uncharacterized protein n=1 Tax=Halonotius terrestris TaxID=2487750 RepID=A0A8J8TBG6_9EURY|nr:hypothetical protein [Halonotius terrestris]TQQ80917.1 hypothetical protein EGH24_07105 [Halonotius terrestris]